MHFLDNMFNLSFGYAILPRRKDSKTSHNPHFWNLFLLHLTNQDIPKVELACYKKLKLYQKQTVQ